MAQQELDPTYFSDREWAKRVVTWVAARKESDPHSFLDGNLTLVRQVLSHPQTGLRMVINIGPDALLNFLATNDYKNIYAHPVIGGERKEPTDERIRVDALLELHNPSEFYFGAVALGGTGVRYYGAFCMVLKRDRVPGGTRIFDRDSYDLLVEPLSGWSQNRMKQIVSSLKGTWDEHAIEMLIMKMLPKLPASQHLITAGTVSELVMTDQEFVEVHLQNEIVPKDLEEVREAPDESAVETTILNRKRNGRSPTAVEIRWVDQRHRVLQALAKRGIPNRVVTLHGAGYQWR
jgi:hypothetical protein